MKIIYFDEQMQDCTKHHSNIKGDATVLRLFFFCMFDDLLPSNSKPWFIFMEMSKENRFCILIYV